MRTNVALDTLTIKEDYTAKALRALAGDMTQSPPHPILGFYAATTGYQFKVAPRANDVCAKFDIDVRLISTKRIIEIAKDLDGTPCMRNAAIKHYRLHDAEHTAALVASSRLLQTDLTAFLDRNPIADTGKGETFVAGFMAKWLRAYDTTLPSIRKAADTPANVAALVRACDL